MITPYFSIIIIIIIGLVEIAVMDYIRADEVCWP